MVDSDHYSLSCVPSSFHFATFYRSLIICCVAAYYHVQWIVTSLLYLCLATDSYVNIL